MWVIAELILCTFGMKFQNWEKSGKRMSSHDVQIFSHFFFGLFEHTVVYHSDDLPLLKHWLDLLSIPLSRFEHYHTERMTTNRATSTRGHIQHV